MKFNLAISILIHENPSFFEIQCINIRHYYPNAKIVVHVNEVLWNTDKKKIKKICLKYNILINPKHLTTGWATPSLFDAIIDNINILNEQPDWTHYIFMSSNELFVSDVLEQKCAQLESDEKIPIIWDSYSDVTPLQENVRDRAAVHLDKGLNHFTVDKGAEIKTGLDFGRIITKGAFTKLAELLNKYWENQNLEPISYSQSEVVLPTLIEYLGKINEIIIIRDLYISTWITNYKPESSEEYIIVKKIPRDKHDPIVKKIMENIGVSYKTNFLDSINSSIKRNKLASKISYKQKQIYSKMIKFFN